MGAQNLALDSLLVSPKPGMDLLKGVSGKVGSKAELNLDKSFDKALRSQVEAKVSKPSAKPEVKDVKDDEPKENLSKDISQVATKDSGSEVPEAPMHSQPQDISTPAEDPESSTAKDGTEIMLNLMISAQESLRAQAQASSENEKGSESDVEAIAQATLPQAASEQTASLQTVQLAQPIQSAEIKTAIDAAKPNQPNEKLNQAENSVQSKTQATSEHSDLSTIDASAKPENRDQSAMNWMEDSGERAKSQDSQSSNAVGDANLQKDLNGKSLKHMIDSLFVQQSLEGQSVEANPLSLQPSKVSVVDSHISPETVRTHLVNDIQPVIQQMVMKDKGGEMTVSLRPAHLGWVKVNVQVDDGVVKVSLLTETPQAKSLLESQVKDLHQSLKESGLKVEGVSVASSSANSSSNNAEMNDQQNPQDSRRDESQSGRDHQPNRQQNSQHRHKEALFAEMMKERSAA